MEIKHIVLIGLGLYLLSKNQPTDSGGSTGTGGGGDALLPPQADDGQPHSYNAVVIPNNPSDPTRNLSNVIPNQWIASVDAWRSVLAGAGYRVVSITRSS